MKRSPSPKPPSAPQGEAPIARRRVIETRLGNGALVVVTVEPEEASQLERELSAARAALGVV